MTLRLAALAFLALTALAQQQPRPRPRLEPPPSSPAEDPNYNFVHAVKAIEIGRYYLKRGNLDAALERFQDAARFKPGFGLPYRWMAVTYEKKKLLSEAVAAYRKYLELYPQAEDAGQIRKRLVKLKKEIERDARKKSSS